MTWFIGFWVIFIGCFVYACHRDQVHPEVCVREEKVVAVGGCDKYGDCGVMTAAGTKVHRRFPVVGEMTCVEKVRR